MEQEFSYKGEIKIVNIENGSEDHLKAESYTAGVGENKYEFSAAKISVNCFSLAFDKKHHIAYAAANDSKIFIHLDGRVIELEIVGDDMKKFSAEGMEYGAKDQIATPMPGKVVKILVNVGDRIELGQALVIVESMKMENEIKSPTNGTVISIHFKDGDLVEPNKPIIKLEPDEE
jgi:biotin carboxyl carrier protein